MKSKEDKATLNAAAFLLLHLVGAKPVSTNYLSSKGFTLKNIKTLVKYKVIEPVGLNKYRVLHG